MPLPNLLKLDVKGTILPLVFFERQNGTLESELKQLHLQNLVLHVIN